MKYEKEPVPHECRAGKTCLCGKPIDARETALVAYEFGCNELTSAFIHTYFYDKETKLKDVEYYWIGGEIGGCLSVNDYFYNMNTMADALRYKVPADKLFEWCDIMAEGKEGAPNLRDFLKLE